MIAGAEEAEGCGEGAVPQHKERVPEADVRRAGAAAGKVLQELPRRLLQ